MVLYHDGLPARPSRCPLHVSCAGRRDELEAAAQQARAEVATAAAELSNARRAAAGQLRVAVEACLADLAMAGNRFDVRIGWIPDPKVQHSIQRVQLVTESTSCIMVCSKFKTCSALPAAKSLPVVQTVDKLPWGMNR